jgi:hypothetical protein
MDTEIAAGRLLAGAGAEGERVRMAADPALRERVQRYLVGAGSVRTEAGATWTFGRRQLDERYILAEFGAREERATLCVLPQDGLLLVDRGGPLAANAFVAAFLRGYRDHAEGTLDAQPLADGEVSAACAALADAGVTTDDGEAAGPFADALDHIASSLAARPTD